MNKMVSIIIPTYNQENYIAETLECVIKQTYKDWECIIVDDGSTDNTCNIVKKYLNEKIKYIKQKQSGVCEARNNGIRNTSGEYILFLDSDDKISDNFLEEAVKCISEDENIKVIAPDIELFGVYNRKYELPEYNIEILMGRNIFIMSSLCRRCDIDIFGGFNNNMKDGLEDWDFWLSILENGGTVKYLNNITFYYRIRKKSRNRSINQETFLKLRRQIYLNHKELFSKYMLNPLETFEYKTIAESAEYRLGIKLLRFYRTIKNIF